MSNVKEMSRVVFDKPTGLWEVQILSSVTGGWIAQGEWRTKQEADADRKHWM